MFWLWYVIAGLFGGIVGGMGMGGGTLLIPIMTLFLGIDQHLSQAINLLVFIPTGILAVIIHAKNKLIDFKMFFILIIPAVCSAVGFAFLANQLESNVLKIIFGIFLICVGIFELIMAIINSCKKKKKESFIDRIGI